MVEALKHVCLVLTFLAGTFFPLPECYLTKPHCPKRASASCPTLNHQQTAKAAQADASGCHACPNGGQTASGCAQPSGQDEGGPLMATLTPAFVLQAQPNLLNPLLASIVIFPEVAAMPSSSGLRFPVLGGPPGPIPLLQRKQTLLI